MVSASPDEFVQGSNIVDRAFEEGSEMYDHRSGHTVRSLVDVIGVLQLVGALILDECRGTFDHGRGVGCTVDRFVDGGAAGGMLQLLGDPAAVV